MIEVLGEGPSADKARQFLTRVPLSVHRTGFIKSVEFEDRGEYKEYFPNNGYYQPTTKRLVLNSRLASDPRTYVDGSSFASHFDMIFAHEIGHGVDEAMGLPSMKAPWLSLSGWTQVPTPGCNRLVIREDGEEKLGEWFFADGAGFPRYYGRSNPWDDFADCYAFYVLGLDGFLPENKLAYFRFIGGIERFS